MSTWRWLHVKAVADIVEGGLLHVGHETLDAIKRKVFAFLGSLPAGVRVITEFAIRCESSPEGPPASWSLSTRKATTMRIVNAASGVVEMACTFDIGLVGPWAWNPSRTKLATVDNPDHDDDEQDTLIDHDELIARNASGNYASDYAYRQHQHKSPIGQGHAASSV